MQWCAVFLKKIKYNFSCTACETVNIFETVILSTGFHCMLVKERLLLLTCRCRQKPRQALNADSAHSRSLNALFRFLMIRILFGAQNRLFYECALVGMWPGDNFNVFCMFSRKATYSVQFEHMFVFYQVVQKHYLERWKMKQHLIAQSLSNCICQKIMKIRSCLLQLQLKMSESFFFETQCI